MATARHVLVIAHQMAKIRFMNEKKRDAFMDVLLEQRADVKGLPFTMGDECRTKADRTAQFNAAVNLVRQAMAEVFSRSSDADAASLCRSSSRAVHCLKCATTRRGRSRSSSPP